jgi:tetratricopeptide (TPR) repeat protein
MFAAAAVLLAAFSCSPLEKMVKMAENVEVTCDPGVLEAVAGSIDPVVKVTYPDGYFNPKAILEVTPVIVYGFNEAKMRPFVYQGEKVKDNYKVVSSEGQTVTEKLHFDYVEGMEKCYLELRGVVKAGDKEFALPARKVADGLNTTYMLVKTEGFVSYKADNYQDTYTAKAEGQIKYLVNSAEVRNQEIKSESIKDFQKSVDAINANDKATVKSTEIVAYASPEGAQDLNNKLSGKRSESAAKAWDKIMKGYGLSDPEIKSIGEDWEGFQKLVSESDIPDKDLILRVLSMYSDPNVRESEIRNMSEVFLALKGEVLPELRRARFIANVEYANYTAEELLKAVEENIDVLDEEALLRAATLVKDKDQKEALYQKAAAKFESARALYNLAALYIEQGKNDKAASMLAKVDASDPDVQNALGVVALRKGDLVAASNYFKKSGTEDAKANLGAVDILLGNYDKAAQELVDAKGCCHNGALAYILTDQLDKAEAAIHCGSLECAYLKAIIAARRGDAEGVKKYLDKASKNKEFKARAENDIEFAGYSL